MTRALGIHHVTAIASDPQRNLDFYAGTLGLRLVKRTVNFDDPQTYHFYFGDEVGSPGSLLTFFPWPNAHRGRPGPGQVAVLAFAILPSSTGFWVERLLSRGVDFEGPAKRGQGRAGREQVISFHDPDGLWVELVADLSAERVPSWGKAPGIPDEHAIHGFHRVTLWVEDREPTGEVLADTLGFRLDREEAGHGVYVAGDGGPGKTVLLRGVGPFPPGTEGAGTVHHIAWRVEDDAAQLELRDRISAIGLDPTPVIDRNYFHSVYFREPEGILFELATDPPGFLIDEPADRLGETLKLPPQYERYRDRIEAVLPVIHLPGSAPTSGGPSEADLEADDVSESLGYVHRYIRRSDDHPEVAEITLLLLHGTGGDENDLVPLAREILPGARILSPRGNVLENGYARFFRRVAEGVFDQQDLERRTAELHSFIGGAARAYGFNRDGVVAIGFSNGANIAASLMLRYPEALRAAVLMSPMVPFEPDTLPDLAGRSVFIGAGRIDPIAPPAQTEALADLLRRAGAEVSVHWSPGGHGVNDAEVAAAREWLGASVATSANGEN